MAWEIPRTNWQPGEGIKALDFNRIEKNTEHLYKYGMENLLFTRVVTFSGRDLDVPVGGVMADSFRVLVPRSMRMILLGHSGHAVYAHIQQNQSVGGNLFVNGSRVSIVQNEQVVDREWVTEMRHPDYLVTPNIFTNDTNNYANVLLQAQLYTSFVGVSILEKFNWNFIFKFENL